MRFLYLLSPATWLKIAFASLFLASASLWYLLSEHSPTMPRTEKASVSDSAVASATGLPSLAASTDLPNQTEVDATLSMTTPPGAGESHAVAPTGILDPYAEFVQMSEIDDSKLEEDLVLPDPVAPPLLLDPNWNGMAP